MILIIAIFVTYKVLLSIAVYNQPSRTQMGIAIKSRYWGSRYDTIRRIFWLSVLIFPAGVSWSKPPKHTAAVTALAACNNSLQTASMQCS